MIETPHSVTLVMPEVEAVPEGWQAALSDAGEITLKVQITPKTPGYAMTRYGADLMRPSKMMGNPDLEPFFAMHGAEVRWSINGRERIFNIRSAHRAHLEGDDNDHVSVMLEEKSPDGGS